MNELDEKLKAYDQRQKDRQPQRDEEDRIAEEQLQESLRQSYLQRTGRTELKP